MHRQYFVLTLEVAPATSERIFQSHSSLSPLGDSLFTISYRQPFVNNFFYFLLLLFQKRFACPLFSRSACIYYHLHLRLSTLFLQFFLKVFTDFPLTVGSLCNSCLLACKTRSQRQKNIVFIQFFQKCALIYIGNNHSPRLSRTAKGNNVKRNPDDEKPLHQPR